MTMVPKPSTDQATNSSVAAESATGAAAVAPRADVRCAVDRELAELGHAALPDPQEGLRQVARVLRAPGTDSVRSIDLLILLDETQQLAGRQHDALVSGRAAVKAADRLQDLARLTMALRVQADAEVCFGSRDAVQVGTLYFGSASRPDWSDASDAELDLDEVLLRVVLAGALRAVSVYHCTGCDRARTMLATLVGKTVRDGWARVMLMATGAAMDTGCTYTCEPAQTSPLPATRPEHTDPQWLARRVRLHPATHICDLAAAPGGAPNARGVRRYPLPTIRNATVWDIRPVAGVLAATLLATRLGSWLEPEPVARGARLFHHHATQAVEAIRRGVARVVEESDQVVAAALWLPCAADSRSAVTGSDGFAVRLDQLGAAAGQPHLQQPHLCLAGLGVLHQWQGRGLATELFTEQVRSSPHSGLCLIAVNSPFAALAARCGFHPYGASTRLTPGDAVIQGMQCATEGSTVSSRGLPARQSVEPRGSGHRGRCHHTARARPGHVMTDTTTCAWCDAPAGSRPYGSGGHDFLGILHGSLMAGMATA